MASKNQQLSGWVGKLKPQGRPSCPSYYILVPKFLIKQKLLKPGKKYRFVPEGEAVGITEI